MSRSTDSCFTNDDALATFPVPFLGAYDPTLLAPLLLATG